MYKKDPRKVYSFLHAKWYDPFKEAWNRYGTPKAESDIRAFLKEHLDEDKSILELGCGTGKNVENILQLKISFKSYLGLDFTEAMLNQAKDKFDYDKRIQFKQQDITDLSDLNTKYDVIISTWVMSHLETPSEVINSAQQLLSNDGSFYIVFVTKPKWFINFWFLPFMLLFRARYVPTREINKIVNVKRIKTYSFNLATSILIKNSH
ncbi:MAG: class I SAM-dependent DNA methyltransferase [Acetobacterium sp.]